MNRKTILCFLLLLLFSFGGCESNDTFSSSIILPSDSQSAASPSLPPTAEEETMDATLLSEFLMLVYGGETAAPSGALFRWEEEIQLSIAGSPTPEDYAVLHSCLDEFSTLSGLPPIAITSGQGNLTIHFIPASQIAAPASLDTASQSHWGIVQCHWRKADHTIAQGTITIACDEPTQSQRNHLIVQSLAKSLGIVGGESQDPASIFYGHWAEHTSLSSRDREIIELLYSPCLQPGMSMNQASEALLCCEG